MSLDNEAHQKLENTFNLRLNPTGPIDSSVQILKNKSKYKKNSNAIKINEDVENRGAALNNLEYKASPYRSLDISLSVYSLEVLELFLGGADTIPEIVQTYEGTVIVTK